ncbi:hypothetical protein [Streptomyces rimosus]|uniref:hypothetical protein n=1 Tax=Streptomyces rimosus TaxID=1927 RepID=UPI0004CB172E|nr:hypothetical protein [Streptomyces rimosus]
MAVRKPTALLIAAGFAAASVLGLTGAASAATPTGFAAQAQRAGLTDAQAGRLQAQVDTYVAELGGKQVSANKILVPGGSMVVRAPGQAYARDLADRTKAPIKPVCDYGHLCGWANGTGGNGNGFDYYHCGYYQLPNLVGNGTWGNNQTPGTVGRFYNKDGSERWNTGPAYSSGTANWTPVWYARPC